LDHFRHRLLIVVTHRLLQIGQKARVAISLVVGICRDR